MEIYFFQVFFLSFSSMVCSEKVVFPWWETAFWYHPGVYPVSVWEGGREVTLPNSVPNSNPNSTRLIDLDSQLNLVTATTSRQVDLSSYLYLNSQICLPGRPGIPFQLPSGAATSSQVDLSSHPDLEPKSTYWAPIPTVLSRCSPGTQLCSPPLAWHFGRG